MEMYILPVFPHNNHTAHDVKILADRSVKI